MEVEFYNKICAKYVISFVLDNISQLMRYEYQKLRPETDNVIGRNDRRTSAMHKTPPKSGPRLTSRYRDYLEGH